MVYSYLDFFIKNLLNILVNVFNGLLRVNLELYCEHLHVISYIY